MNNPPEDERTSRDDAFLADLYARAEEEIVPTHPDYDPDEGLERFLTQIGNSQSAVPSGRRMTLEQLEALYAAEYPKLVKVLVLLDATIEEAEDAAQKAMADFTMRSRTAKAPDHKVAYLQRAAVRFFIKERQRGRERLQRELRGAHLVIEMHHDDRLTTLEDEQYIEHLLESLTSTQQRVIKLVMDGLSTHEIAEELGKSDENIRQHLKNSRDRLKLHPEIAPLAPRQVKKQSPGQQETRSAVTTPEPNLFEAVERRITPEYVAKRFRELQLA